ncbi:hypothetical protein BLL42_11425 [Pseudomonas frederiksbergensis]|uniref:Uncharacterized protein n=1 Tax=Pseudomonas frederiksbergensis TaxID=104087 RepID=A0A1J0EKF8_9PSED|nr:hypothetical protein [Pseudomonas frederiksbergensis]APC16308.1 hypothetical protein BLL42_11425 [Pseudomonas frederiksbergensis]
MKVVNGLLGILLGLAVSLSAHAVADSPKHAFKNSYDQLLEELPNVRSQLTETDTDGLKRWVGTVPVGSAASIVQISGKGKDAITELTVMLLFTATTTNADYDNAEALRDVLFQGLLGRGAAFGLVNDFWVHELARQQPIIRAGGKPKSGVKTVGKGTSQVSLELVNTPQGLMAIYSMKLL